MRLGSGWHVSQRHSLSLLKEPQLIVRISHDSTRKWKHIRCFPSPMFVLICKNPDGPKGRDPRRTSAVAFTSHSLLMTPNELPITHFLRRPLRRFCNHTFCLLRVTLVSGCEALMRPHSHNGHMSKIYKLIEGYLYINICTHGSSLVCTFAEIATYSIYRRI